MEQDGQGSQQQCGLNSQPQCILNTLQVGVDQEVPKPVEEEESERVAETVEVGGGEEEQRTEPCSKQPPAINSPQGGTQELGSKVVSVVGASPQQVPYSEQQKQKGGQVKGKQKSKGSRSGEVPLLLPSKKSLYPAPHTHSASSRPGGSRLAEFPETLLSAEER